MEYFLLERGTDDRMYVMYVVRMYKLMCVFIYDLFIFFELFFSCPLSSKPKRSAEQQRRMKKKICKTMDLYHIGELFVFYCVNL